jgi:exodeoxyribonuclease VII small subunit
MPAMSKKASEPQGPAFEQAIEQVEGIIEQIESGQIGLEESITRYEQGMKLIQHCRAILDRAETKIRQLTVDEDGKLKEADET